MFVVYHCNMCVCEFVLACACIILYISSVLSPFQLDSASERAETTPKYVRAIFTNTWNRAALTHPLFISLCVSVVLKAVVCCFSFLTVRSLLSLDEMATKTDRRPEHNGQCIYKNSQKSSNKMLVPSYSGLFARFSSSAAMHLCLFLHVP